MKQGNLFGEEELPTEESKYTAKIKAPIYEPKGLQPHILELMDNSKTKRLITEINNSEIPDEIKTFLIEAAKRHTVFNYEKIANYYAHAPAEIQHLMEKSALVIIDFEKAILYGYAKLSSEIANNYLEDYGDEKQ